MIDEPKAILTPPATPERTSSSRRRSPPLNRFGSPPHQRYSHARRPATPPTPPELYTFAFVPTLRGYVGKEDDEDEGGVFELSAMARALEDVERGMSKREGDPMDQDKSQHVVIASKKVRPSGKVRRAFIMKLPDEVLLMIFNQLHDHDGFPCRSTRTGPEWYTPPIKMTLVCRRWLPLARQLFYRTISIHHAARIPSLARTLADLDLAALVRRISIRLPEIAPASRRVTNDSDMVIDRETTTSGTTLAGLRRIFQSCPNLLRIEISAKSSPASIFLPYISPTPHLTISHLHHLSFQSVTTLVLASSFPREAGDGIKSEDLRGALLGLTGLRHLSITGYVPTSTALDFSTKSTLRSSSRIRSLPLRARRLHLVRLDIIDCSFPPSDLAALLSHVVPGSLRELTITEVHRRGGLDPTIAGLPPLAPHLSSLRSLRLSLYNYDESTSTLDTILPHLPILETLDMGGSVCGPTVLDLLPPSLRTLRLRVLPNLPSSVVRSFLQQIAERKGRFGTGGSGMRQGVGNSWEAAQWESWPQLKKIDVWGGESLGWRAGTAAWEVQKACWDAGVVWGK